MDRPRICPICWKTFVAGSTCPDDGAMLVLRARPASQETRGPVRPEPRPGARASSAGARLRPSRRNVVLGIAGTVLLVGGIGYDAFVRSPRTLSDDAARAAAEAPRPIGVGVSAALGAAPGDGERRLLLGLEAAFAFINKDGGIDGRKLRCIALDDAGDPGRARAVARSLVEYRKVFALAGGAGTPAAIAAASWAADRNVVFLGVARGSETPRPEPHTPTVFTLGATWADEASVVIRYHVETRKIRPSEIAVLAGRQPLQESAFLAVTDALGRYGRAPREILRVADPEASGSEDAIVLHRPALRALVVAAPARPAAAFVARLRERESDALVALLSVSDLDAFAEELRHRAAPAGSWSVVATQPVPPVDASLPGVAAYREVLAKRFPEEKGDVLSLEGWVAGRVLAEALRRAGQEPTTQSVVAAFEEIRELDLGVGATVSFGPSQHHAFRRVWGVVLDSGARWRPLPLP